MISNPDSLIEVAALGLKLFFKRTELSISPEKIKLFLKKGFKLQVKKIKSLDLGETELALQSKGLTGDIHIHKMIQKLVFGKEAAPIFASGASDHC